MKSLLQMGVLAIALVAARTWSDEVPMDSVLAAAREGSRVIGLRYPEPESTKFLTRVLKALEIPYAVKNQDEAITVYWAPANSEQEQEVQNRVSQFDFVRKVCPSLQVPLPSDVAKAELSC